MAEAVSDARTGNRRRLPSWMLQANTCDKLKSSLNMEEGCSLSEEATKIQAAESKKKPVRNNDKSLTQDAETMQKAGSLQGCERRQKCKVPPRTKKAPKRDEDPCTSLTACAGVKRRPKKRTDNDGEPVHESIPSRDQHAKRKRTKNNEVNSPEGSDAEVSLTVEDLITIAKEYVSADKEHSEQMAISRNTTGTNSSSLSISSSLAMSRTLQAGGSSQIFNCISSRCGSSENVEKKRENHKVEKFASSIGSTEDVAQDMLNLYLGPFFKKCGEQSIRTAETKESQSGYVLIEPAKSCETSEGDVPMMKKKISLKDKVAMFSD